MMPKSINRWWIDWISNQPRKLNPSPNIGWLKFLTTLPLKAIPCKFALAQNSCGGQQTRSYSFDGYHRPTALSLQFIMAVDVHSKLAGQPTRSVASFILSYLWESISNLLIRLAAIAKTTQKRMEKFVFGHDIQIVIHFCFGELGSIRGILFKFSVFRT